jgi:HIRAN domain
MQIFSPIVGAHFRPSEAKALYNSLTLGDEVILRAEPDNAYDPMAVMVLYEDEHIGYIARQNNYQVSEWLQDGGEVEAKIIAREGNKHVLLISWDAENTYDPVDFPAGIEDQ